MSTEILYTSNPWRRRRVQLAAMTAALAIAATGFAQTPYFQHAGIVATGNTISMTRVPVVISPTTTIYKDLILQFDTDASGNFALTAGFPVMTDSPALMVSSIVPGNYAGPSNINSGKNLLTISGPGVMAGGVLAYAITLSTGAAGTTNPGGGTIYVGPVENSPLAARLKKANITSPAWSYGLGSTGSCYSPGYWCSAGIIGVSQIGNTITFASFSTTATDRNEPFDQITYTLVQ